MTFPSDVVPPQTEVIDLTPERASRYLGRNRKNRSLRPRVSQKYADDMRNGRWAFTGEPITFDRDGYLINGQHRCQAVIESGVTIPVVVVRNLNPSAQRVTDTGVARTASDALHLDEIVKSDPRTVAAVARLVALWKEGYRWSLSSAQHPVSIPRIVETITEDPAIEDAAVIARRISKDVCAAPSVIGLCYWVFSRIDASASEQFFMRLASPAGHDEGSPVLVLRERLRELRNRTGMTISSEQFLVLFTRAWNAYREGRSITLLKFANRAHGDAFPEPR